MHALERTASLAEVESELRGPRPRPMRWKIKNGLSLSYQETLTDLLQQGTATRARILQCEWFDDGNTDPEDKGPSARLKYLYYDQNSRQYVKTVKFHFDAWHLALNPSYVDKLTQTWRVGGWVTVLYQDTNPSDSYAYFRLPIQLINLAQPKQRCPCCGLLMFEPEKQNSSSACQVCGWIKDGDNPVTLQQGKQNWKLFGACDETVLYNELRQPFPEEIDGSYWIPPHIWLVGLSLKNPYWQGIWEALRPLRSQFEQDGQLLIAEYPNLESKAHPVEWWNIYEPTNVSFIQWYQILKKVVAPLNASETTIRGICEAVAKDFTPRFYCLNLAKIRPYSFVANWTYWYLIADETRIIECRFGKAKK